MPHLLAEHHGAALVGPALQKAPLGPGFSAAVVGQAAVLRIIGSLSTDPGPDWVRYELRSDNGDVVAEATIPGY